MRSRVVVLLSGRICSGKTSLARELEVRAGFAVVSTRSLIAMLRPDTPDDRQAYQQAGDELDETTNGGWVAQGLRQWLEVKLSDQLIVDSVRRLSQCDAVRQQTEGTVVHIHLAAPIDVLRARFDNAASGLAEPGSYDALRANRTEESVDDLADTADATIATGGVEIATVAELARQVIAKVVAEHERR